MAAPALQDAPDAVGAPGALGALGGSSATSTPAIKLTVRKEFPETFIWQNYDLDSNETSG